MPSSVRDEIPDSPAGLNQYANYCVKQIRENRLLTARIRKRLEWCHEKAEAMGIELKIIEKE